MVGSVLITGGAFTRIVFEAVVAGGQVPPVGVSTKVAVPEKPAGAVHVAFKVFASGLKEPPAVVDQVPPVAVPETDPPKGADVPPWQMAASAAPALADEEQSEPKAKLIGTISTIIKSLEKHYR